MIRLHFNAQHRCQYFQVVQHRGPPLLKRRIIATPNLLVNIPSHLDGTEARMLLRCPFSAVATA
jgi:hypothetical protein